MDEETEGNAEDTACSVLEEGKDLKGRDSLLGMQVKSHLIFKRKEYLFF